MMLTAFLLGAMGSLHCLGMCGPVAFLLPLHRARPIKAVAQATLYHFGRIFSYTSLGLFSGILGKGLLIFGSQQKLSLLVGGIMILSVALPSQWIPRKALPAPVSRFLFRMRSGMATALRLKGPEAFLAVGLLNGLLPCGLVYMAILGSLASGNPFEASAFMMAFGLGTIPLMTAAITVGTAVRVPVRERIRKFIPVLVALIGLLFILRGLGLGIPYLSPTPVENGSGGILECHP